jgi:hypothetical protein
MLTLAQQATWPLAHYPARRLLNHAEDEYWNALNKNCIAILGRGPSLKNVHELEFIDTFIIINQFEFDDETVRSALRSKYLLHFTNIAEHTLTLRNYYLFNFIGYQLSTREGEDGWGGKRQLRGVPEFYGFKPRDLPKEIEQILKEDFDPGINTTGMLAVLYAAEVSDASHIYTAGIDFFDPGLAGYLSSDDPSEERIKRRKSRSSDIKRDMNAIAKLYPETHFHIVTQSTYDPHIENIHIYSRGIRSNAENN